MLFYHTKYVLRKQQRKKEEKGNSEEEENLGLDEEFEENEGDE